MEKGKGIIGSVNLGSYGDGDAFSEGVASILAPTTIVEQEPIKEEVKSPIINEVKEPIKVKEVKPELVKQEIGNEGEGYLLAEMFKRDGLLSDDVILARNASISEVYAKVTEDLAARKQAAILEGEDIIAKKYGPEVIKNAQLLSSGLSPAQQTELAQLNAYANTKIEFDTDDGRENAKFLIEEMYRSTLKGKALERAIDNIDVYGDDFEDLANESHDFWQEKRDVRRDGILKEVNDIETESITFSDKIKSAIEEGKVFGIELDRKSAQRYANDIYKPTEVMTIRNKDGVDEIRKVSKHDKNLYEIQRDPAKMALLQCLIADGLDLNMPISMGKAKAGQELEEKLSGKLRQQPTNGQEIARSVGTLRNVNYEELGRY